MSEQLIDILTTFSPLIVMWAAVLANLALPIPYAAHPARVWYQFAQLLASKVNLHRSYQQDLISGTLACGLMLFPAFVLLLAIKTLAWEPHYFEFALLLLALDWRHQLHLANKIGQFLSQEDKDNARLELSPLLNRQVTTLSIVGLGKATCETLLSGHSRQVISVLFWFGVSGGIGAFTYRLACELHRAWSPSRTEFRPFGLASARLVLVLEWLPLRLFLVLTLLGKNSKTILQQAKTQTLGWPSPNQGWLLAIVGHKLQLAMGGPAIYQNKKMVRAKLGGRIAPSAIHISQVMKLLNQRTLYWLAIQSIIIALICLVPHA
ncbi:cobalamin biosynthesis family protein [Vibrio sp. WJH972]